MRSVPLGMRLPIVYRPIRRIRPQSSGLLRRSLVKSRLWLSRSAGLSVGGRAAVGAVNIFRLAIGMALVGVRILGGGLLGSLAALLELGLRAGRPAVRGGRLVAAWADAAGQVLQGYFLRHRARRGSRLTPMLAMLACTVTLFAAGYFGLGLEVSLEGHSLGFITSREEIDQIIREVEARASEYIGAPCVLTPDFSYSLRYLEPENMMDADALKSTLFNSVSGTAEGQYVLKVDGRIVGGSASKVALSNMLDRIKKSRSIDGPEMKTEFVQKVAIEAIGSLPVDLGSIAETEALLTSNSAEMRTYTIASGDTVSQVASRYNMSVGQIAGMNPNLNIDRISIGQEIMVSAAVPYLSLRQMRTETYEEEVPFKTVVEYSDKMYTNQSKILVQGKPGLDRVVADVVYVDGAVTDREELNRSVIRQPVDQVKSVGTQKPPPKSATGKFIKPSSGRFSSGYGYRKNLRDNHTGVDFSGRVGTSIWASDGGTVTFAGWKGNYGKCVIIDHGNGFQTLYGHCSELLVKKGQKVAQREQIAKVGNTGRSTGPHVHFEILVNGKHVNPLKYIPR